MYYLSLRMQQCHKVMSKLLSFLEPFIRSGTTVKNKNEGEHNRKQMCFKEWLKKVKSLQFVAVLKIDQNIKEWHGAISVVQNRVVFF